ncbi:dTDP-4-dehydrorhamnose reductase [Methyloradius palustris]|uniref:dTDP-4-dehydrorhamnose reductase n=1 Tax=Methyloradius palustris TaxID=2778876 RepID=A0A8D5GE42_9PROT|nr:dTDP-4-dehydrorhamnose reductase [Methyloradius palustris]BCM24969.1 NAD(P)-dependent oxidoreductase [Methyloradius palustris]
MQPFKRILLTGVNGQVGHALKARLTTIGELVALDRSQLDLANADAIRSAVQAIKPDLIINPAAYTAVDIAESQPLQAQAVNAIAPGIFAEEAAKINALLIHYSTDYVFDGLKNSPYVEDDLTQPVSVYGKSKLAGEDAIRAVGVPHLILRTSWVYGSYGKNFLRTILRLASEREGLKIVADQIGAPTSADAIADATVTILRDIKSGQSGTYHLTNAGETSLYGFAQGIVDTYEGMQAVKGWPDLKTYVSNILPITTSEYPTPAARPANSRLNCSKLKHDFNIELADWREALLDVMHSANFRPQQ